jgi:ribonuclease P protein component
VVDASPGPGPAAVAYAVGRKVGGAVVRNRLRRRLRALVAAHAGLRPGAAYLVTPDAAAAAMSPPELAADVHAALDRATRGLR